jgi:hypothetical protein
MKASIRSRSPTCASRFNLGKMTTWRSTIRGRATALPPTP